MKKKDVIRNLDEMAASFEFMLTEGMRKYVGITPSKAEKLNEYKETLKAAVKLLNGETDADGKANGEGSFDDVFAFIPEKRAILTVSEGTGGNLTKEDEKEGYVDYVDYSLYSLDEDWSGGLPLVDGGMIMTTFLVRDMCRTLADWIPYVLESIYGEEDVDYQVLKPMD